MRRSPPIFILPLFCLFLARPTQGQTPSFPGAMGLGSLASGGRGKAVYHVTNLNDSGAGSLRDAVSVANRTVVFDVGGYITLTSKLAIKSGITIAGQTAPGGGIGVRGRATSCNDSSNIIIRNVRFRPGADSPNEDNGLSLTNARLVMLDRISVEFANWNNLSGTSDDWQTKPVADITVQNSIVANPTYQQFGAHIECVQGTWSWIRNLFVSGHGRQPMAKVHTIFVNNVVYNYESSYNAHSGTAFKHDLVNNYWIYGPVGSNTFFQTSSNQSFYAAGNLVDTDKNGALSGTSIAPISSNGSITVLTSPWSTVTNTIPTLSAADAYRNNLAIAGAWPRDAVDSLVASQVKTLGLGTAGKGVGTTGPPAGLYTHENQTGLPNGGFGDLVNGVPPIDSDRDGLPDDWESAKGLNANLGSDGAIIQASGYSNLEDYLNWLILPHTFMSKHTTAQPQAVDFDLRNYAYGAPAGAVFTVSGITNGAVTQTGTGGYAVHFVPTLNFSGLASFTFSVTNAGFTITQPVGILVSPNPPPKNLNWQGNGVTNNWNAPATTWFDAGTNTATIFSDGDRVSFLQAGSNTPAVNLTGVLKPSFCEVNADKNYTFSGSGYLSGGMALIVNGAGNLTLNNGANNYSGGTSVDGSTLILSGNAQPGAGPVTLTNSGNLTANYAAASRRDFSANTITVPAGEVGSFTLSPLMTVGGGTGSGTLNLRVSGTAPTVPTNALGNLKNYITGSWSGFSGILNITGTVPGAQLDLNINGGTFTDFAAATVNMDNVKMQSRHNSGGNSIAIGALNGTASATLGGTEYAGPATYTIGGLDTDCVFAGTVRDGQDGSAAATSVPTLLTKVGNGRLVLSGNLLHTGVTTVSAGSLSSTSTFNGLVTVAGGSLSPGLGPNMVGTMTAGKGLTLTSGTLSYDLSSSPTGTNDQIIVSTGILTTSSNVTVKVKMTDGYLTAGTYNLVSGNASMAAGSNTTPVLTSPLPATGTRQTLAVTRGSNGAAPGFLRLVVTGNASNLTWTGANGGIWDLSTTAAWTSTAPTNPNLFYQWDNVTLDDSSSVGTVALAGSLQPRLMTVNNTTRNYTLSGTGTLDGAMQLVKSGSGILTMSATGASTYTGGTVVNGGVLAVSASAPNALGTGPVTLNGGMLDLGAGGLVNNSLIVNGTATVRSASGNGTLVNTTTNSLSSTGAATLNFQIPSGLCTINAPMNNFSGTISLGTSAGQLRLNGGTNANFGSAGAHFNLGTATGSLSNRNGGLTMALGAISGGPNTTLQGRQSASGATASTYIIGALNLDTTFAGHINHGGDNLGLNVTKVGTGNWTLTGTSTFTGDVSIQAGQMTIAGNISNVGDFLTNPGSTLRLTNGSITTDKVEIASGAQLVGCGTINGDLENHGTVNIDCANGFTVTGDVSNDGVLRITHGAVFSTGGVLTNRGTIDLIGSPATNLPAGFVNQGTVLDSTNVKVRAITQAENSLSISIQTYAGHTYTLQTSSGLGGWVPLVNNLTTTTDGQGVQTWTITNPPAGSKFYRISVGP